MSGSRPAYGEYASPEEQARRMNLDPPSGAVAPEKEQAPSAPRSDVRDAAPRQAAAAGGEQGRAPLVAPLTGARRADRLIAILLVIWGLISVIRNVPILTDLASFFYDAFELWGVDAELSDPAAAHVWGVASASVLGVGWLLTALVTWLRTRRGRLVFWVPLVGAVVTGVVVTVMISVPLASDPALMQQLMDQMGTLP